MVTGRGSKLAVECDGDAWHSTTEQLQSDLDRELELRRCGWTLWRVRESEYYLDKDRALSDLWTTLDDLGIGPFQADIDGETADLAEVWIPAPLPDDESPLDEESDLTEPAQVVAAPSVPIATLAGSGLDPGSEASTPLRTLERGAAERLTASHGGVVTEHGLRRMTAGDDDVHKECILRLASEGPVSNGDARAATGLDGVQVRELLTQLIAEGSMFRTGQKRGTRYHLSD